MKCFFQTMALLAVVAMAALPARSASAGEPESKVFLNGEAMPVFFNDGDSFRVLSGSKKGAKARIAGYNTLETHGAVHQWGDWTVKEMYVIAKLATLHARRGVWECTTDGKTDTYGRMLTFCPGLGEELIRMGLAHAMTVTDEPADPKFLAAQREAIAEKRGMWAHGVPAFVLTSLHSAEEDLTGRGTYNRLVSSADGHSVKWKHTTKYRECQKVCQAVYDVEEAEVGAALGKLLADPEAGPIVKALQKDDRISVVRDYAKFRHVNRLIGERQRETVKKALRAIAKSGAFTGKVHRGSCVVHVPFERRFGGTRAKCLR